MVFHDIDIVNVRADIEYSLELIRALRVFVFFPLRNGLVINILWKRHTQKRVGKKKSF